MMKIQFEYNRDRDVWCLLNKGKSSNNSPLPTKVYEELIDFAGENLNKENTSAFIDQYINKNSFNIEKSIQDCEKDSLMFLENYKKIAESLFKVSLDKDVTAYLTVNTRCPYSVEENWFYISVSNVVPRMTIMHELWHFYTWYKFGSYEEKIGKQRYNDAKEALTVLINVECKDLLPEGKEDRGYVQHKELRDKILQLWSENKDIEKLWDNIVDISSHAA